MKWNKYGARKTKTLDANGEVLTFDSSRELERWLELKIMERGKAIKNLQRQVPFELVPKHKREDGKTERAVTYIADFVYTENGKTIVEDVKGYRTKEYIIKRKLMLDRHGITIKEV